MMIRVVYNALKKLLRINIFKKDIELFLTIYRTVWISYKT